MAVISEPQRTPYGPSFARSCSPNCQKEHFCPRAFQHSCARTVALLASDASTHTIGPQSIEVEALWDRFSVGEDSLLIVVCAWQSPRNHSGPNALHEHVEPP